jgi:formate hydrogenlyase transcriptional activator
VGTSLEAEVLLSIAVAVTSEQRVESVLQKTVHGLAAQPGVALARIWLLPSIHLPSSRGQPPDATEGMEHLHLVASAGTPINSPGEDWSLLQGHFARLPMHVGKVGQVAAERHPILIKDITHEDSWIVRPEWAKREAIRSFAAYPLLFRDKLLGVMATFSRKPLEDQEFAWLGLFANHAAVAIANTRAFEDLKRAEEILRSNERNLNLLTNVIPTHIHVLRSDGSVLYVNQTVLDYLGLTLEDVRREDYRARVFHPEDVERLREERRKALTRAVPFENEQRVLAKDGRYRWFLIRYNPLLDEQGRIDRWYVAAFDIEDRKRAEAQVEQAYLHLAEAQRLSTTGSFSWRPAGGEIIWSDETYQIFNLERATKPTVEVVLQRTHPEDRKGVQQLLERATSDASDWELKHRIVTPNGVVKHLHVVAHTMRAERAGDTEYVGAVMDVTASTESRQALEKAYAEIHGLKEQLQKENIVLRDEIDQTSMFEEIVGASPPLRTVLSHVAKVAPTDSTVLITGETGTGKERIARAIHERSRRASRVFVSVNCGAIPSTLFASELFGHEKGAFTGSVRRKLGRFELADGGTLFLDEVGELPPETQSALLRVLQERQIERVGGGGPIAVDVRVIAATNRDLKAGISAGAFRADLYYRLNVFPIAMPSLRARAQDIPLLVEYFVDRYAKKAGKRIRGVSKATLSLLQQYPWPGNVRELQNVIERGVILSEGDMLSVDETWLAGTSDFSDEAGRENTLVGQLTEHERQMIEAALAETHGVVSGPSGAAGKLKIAASTLESRIRALGIDKRRFKQTY